MMKTIVLSGLAVAVTATVAMAEPVKVTDERSTTLRSGEVRPGPLQLTDAEMDTIAAGAITQTNPGGNVPGGEARGIPATNPAGQAPPGQNK